MDPLHRPIRATLDPDTIDAWQAQLALYRRRGGNLYSILMVPGVVCILLGLFTSWRWIALAGPLCLAIALGADAAARRVVRCPHCRESPYLSARNANIKGLQWCERCFYWLRKPY
jgi:hypothetical protein